MLRVIYLIIIMLLVIFGIVFAVLNAEPVQLNYYFNSSEVPLSLVLVLTMLLGAILGVLASASLIITSKREAARLKKSADMAEKEIANLRAIPIRDEH